jgi:hypothetical protein
MTHRDNKIYGLMAEFDGPERLIKAARSARDSGYTNLQAYTPFPIEELSDYVTVRRRNWVPAIVLIGGILGGSTGFLMQYFAMAISYPLNVGGRPLFSWPSFIPITFELTVLGAALFGAFGMLALNGLPRPFHPVFTVPKFRLASNSGFFLCIKSADEMFDPKITAEFLEELNPAAVTEIYNDRSTE